MTHDEADFLMHFGKKGMKWGHRTNRAPGYTDDQVKRDKQVYGNRGANRINKNMLKGDNISTARGSEKTRRDRVMNKNKYVRQFGKLAGGAVGAVVGFIGSKQLSNLANTAKGSKIVNKMLGQYSEVAKYALSNPAVQFAIASGAAQVGYMLSGDAAVSANMRLHGYDPNRR